MKAFEKLATAALTLIRISTQSLGQAATNGTLDIFKLPTIIGILKRPQCKCVNKEHPSGNRTKHATLLGNCSKDSSSLAFHPTLNKNLLKTIGSNLRHPNERHALPFHNQH